MDNRLNRFSSNKSWSKLLIGLLLLALIVGLVIYLISLVVSWFWPLLAVGVVVVAGLYFLSDTFG